MEVGVVDVGDVVGAGESVEVVFSGVVVVESAVGEIRRRRCAGVDDVGGVARALLALMVNDLLYL
jgi:hypothetical protein